MRDGKRLAAYYYVSRWGASDDQKRHGFHRHSADGGLRWPAQQDAGRFATVAEERARA